MEALNKYRSFIICVLLTFCTTINNSFAQIYVYDEDEKISDTIFNITDLSYLTWRTFYTPGFNIYKESTRAIELKFKKTDSSSKFSMGNWRKPTKARSDLIFFSRLHTENIQRLLVYSVNGELQFELASVKFQRDGYQWPIEESIQLNTRYPFEDNSDSLVFKIQKKDAKKESKITISECWIGIRKIDKRVIPSPLFLNPPFNNIELFNIENYRVHDFNSYGLYSYYPKEYFDESFSTRLIAESSLEEKYLIFKILTACIDGYPFYKEKAINKVATKNSFKALLNRIEELQLCDCIDSLNNFLYDKFYDPHFQVTNDSCMDENYSRGPIILFPVKGEYVIASVLDDDLRKQVPLGSKIIELDGKAFSAICKDKLYPELNNYRKVANVVAVNKLLSRKAGDSIDLKILTPEGLFTRVRYPIKEKYKVTRTYKQKQGSLKVLNASTIYFKINSILRDIPLIFSSRIDEVNQYKNLIIDLRGNGGGESEEGARLLSYLVPKNFTFSKLQNRVNGKIDSTIVKTNNHFRYRIDGKIIVLVDEYTASAAESFTYTLRKNRTNVRVVGKSSTMGAVATVYNFKLSNSYTVIRTDSPAPAKKIFNKKIEDIGIEPDLLVEINNVDDLQPYTDKVLREAILLLRTF